MKTFLAATAAIVLAAMPASAATLIQYDFTGQAGNQASTGASRVAANLSGLAFTRGAGLTATGAANSINSSGFSTAADDFYNFGFTVTGGVTATVNQLIFGSQASNTGPGFINVLAAIDGGAFTQVGSFALEGGTNLSQALTLTAPVTGRERIDFRFVAASNTSANGGTIGSGGTLRVTNFQPTAANTAFTIDGALNQVAAVPEPSAWAMMILGVGLVGASMRRRKSSVRTSARFA